MLLTVFGYLDAEVEAISNAHSLHLALACVQNANPWWWCLGRRVDVNHFGIADGHHAERDVLRAHVVGALHLVDLVSLGHDHAVMLQHHRVGVDASLPYEKKIKGEG